MSDEIIARIDPKPGRRVFAAGTLGLLGMLLLWLAAAHPPADLGWLAFLVILGGGNLYLSWALWRVTGVALILTREDLREEGGRVLCRIDEVKSVDRGFFAFKPSNGFLVRLKAPGTRVYAPGLWWRFGRTLMVGGVTSGAQSKTVADLISMFLVEREAGR